MKNIFAKDKKVILLTGIFIYLSLFVTLNAMMPAGEIDIMGDSLSGLMPAPMMAPVMQPEAKPPMPESVPESMPFGVQEENVPLMDVQDNSISGTMGMGFTPTGTTTKLVVSDDSKKFGPVSLSIEDTKSSYSSKNPNELDFEVENKTGKTIFVCCFSWIKKNFLSRWRWDKSPIYKLENGHRVTIDIDTIPDMQERQNIYGYLAIFVNQKEAQAATYELLKDGQKIELDLLTHLKGKKVVIEIEKYGTGNEFFDYDFVKIDKKGAKVIPELDFVVENRTGKTIVVTCFVYQKKAKGTWLAQKTKESWSSLDESRDDMSVWRFDKTPIITLKDGESGIIDVDTIIEKRDREYVRGYLAIFDEEERNNAEKSVYELLEYKKRIDVGPLKNLHQKKIEIRIEQYGAFGDFLDYVIKPVKKIDFAHLNEGK